MTLFVKFFFMILEMLSSQEQKELFALDLKDHFVVLLKLIWILAHKMVPYEQYWQA